MAEPNLTPEERLLRIIDSPQKAVQAMRPRRGVQDLKASLNFFKDKYTQIIKENLNLKTANSALVVVVAAAMLFLGVDFWLGSSSPRTIERLSRVAKKLDIADTSLEQLDPLSVYVSEIVQRNIFALPKPTESESAAQKQAKSNIDLSNLIDGLKMVGVIWSDAPQAIVEDIKENRTYLLNRGGRIRQARVKDILKDRVVLSYDDNIVELR